MYILGMVKRNEENRLKLLAERGLDFAELAQIIDSGEARVVDVKNQNNHAGQKMFVVTFEDYPVCVPFVVEENGDFFLKTAFRNRHFK